MPLAVVLAVSVTEPATAPVALARALHAWLLNALPPALATALHAGNDLRPITISNLMGGGKPDEGRVALVPGRPAYLRLTALTHELEQALLACLPAAGDPLPLLDLPLRVTSVAHDVSEHPWAGQASCVDLIQQHTLQSGPTPTSLTLDFISPTLFHVAGREVPLPDPALVFGSLWRKWNAFAPRPLPDEVEAFARTQVELGRFHLRSQIVLNQQAGKGDQAGFVGQVSFRFRRPDPYAARALALLAAYALWAGVGYGASRGLGQARLVSEEELRHSLEVRRDRAEA